MVTCTLQLQIKRKTELKLGSLSSNNIMVMLIYTMAQKLCLHQSLNIEWIKKYALTGS